LRCSLTSKKSLGNLYIDVVFFRVFPSKLAIFHLIIFLEISERYLVILAPLILFPTSFSSENNISAFDSAKGLDSYGEYGEYKSLSFSIESLNI
jgi:hypothetical protein